MLAIQPIFSLQDNSIYGHEVLARWSNFRPDEIFGIAQERHAVIDLEEILLSRIIKARKKIEGRLFINVHPSLPNPQKWGILKDHNVILEITEISDIRYEGISILKDSNFRLALDDIGTGSATLDNLTRLQPDYLKLDKTLIQSKNTLARNSLIKAFVDHACRLNSKVIVEGIETLEQFNAAKDSGAHFGQGYLLGRPQVLNHVNK